MYISIPLKEIIEAYIDNTIIEKLDYVQPNSWGIFKELDGIVELSEYGKDLDEDITVRFYV